MASIELTDVRLTFPMLTASSRSLKNAVFSAATGGRIAGEASKVTEVIALDGINLRMVAGQRLGLIGHNGSGKSTLLRVMAGIYPPTAGEVTTTGKVGSLFDATLGMDREATGYENILLRGIALGLSRAEISAIAPEIAEFTELGPFLDVPLRAYSAGMASRLGFAISTSIQPDVLIVDEGIGTGDAQFIAKATERVTKLFSSIGILVLASHSEALLRTFCTDVAVLEHGRIVHLGPIDEALTAYHERTQARAATVHA